MKNRRNVFEQKDCNPGGADSGSNRNCPPKTAEKGGLLQRPPQRGPPGTLGARKGSARGAGRLQRARAALAWGPAAPRCPPPAGRKRLGRVPASREPRIQGAAPAFPRLRPRSGRAGNARVALGRAPIGSRPAAGAALSQWQASGGGPSPFLWAPLSLAPTGQLCAGQEQRRRRPAPGPAAPRRPAGSRRLCALRPNGNRHLRTRDYVPPAGLQLFSSSGQRFPFHPK